MRTFIGTIGFMGVIRTRTSAATHSKKRMSQKRHPLILHTQMTENMDKLHFIAQFLFKNEIMDEYQFEAVMSGEATTVEELEALSAERKQRSKDENDAKAKRDDEARIKREEEERRLRELVGGGNGQLYRTPDDRGNNNNNSGR